VKSILDRSFQYTPSAQTDVRKTFARVRREQKMREASQSKADVDVNRKVSPIRPASSAATG
jgi:hypothetical protein